MRSHKIFEETFYIMLTRLTNARGKVKDKRFKFKMPVVSVDSTTIGLCLSLFDRAKFRKTKGDIKLHVMYNNKEQLPGFINISAASNHDIKDALKFKFTENTMYTFDKGYICFDFFSKNNKNRAFFVTRTKSNTQFKIIKRNPKTQKNNRRKNMSKNNITEKDKSLQGNNSETEKYKKYEDYWKESLNNIPLSPEIPQKKLKNENFTVNRHMAVVEKNNWQSIKRMLKKAEVTTSGFFLALFSELLRKWSSNKDFTLNFMHSDLDKVFRSINDVNVNSPESMLITLIEQNEVFEDRMKNIQTELDKRTEKFYIVGSPGYQEILNKAQIDRTKISFAFSYNSDFDSKHSQVIDKGYTINQTPQTCFNHICTEQDDQVLLMWETIEEAFPENMIQDMFDSYLDIINDLAEDEKIWNFKMLPIRPQKQFLRRKEFDSVKVPVSKSLLHHGFEKHAAEFPNDMAVANENYSLTYEELNIQANRLAWQLFDEEGAAVNSLVAVVMEKGIEQIIAVLGILKAGAAYLPIDANQPAERIETIVEQGNVSILVTRSSFNEKCKSCKNTKVLVIDEVRNRPCKNETKNPPSRQKSGDLAYVLFTSGSTGTPKGVMINHQGALNTISDLNDRFKVNSKDRILALASLSFDISVYDTFGMLNGGAAIVIPTADKIVDPEHWYQLVKKYDITLWGTVPQMMEIFVEYIDAIGQTIPESIRVIMMGGDWIPVKLPGRIRQLEKKEPNYKLQIIGLGGVTEASIWSAIYPIDKVEESWKSIPYGRPMKNQSLYVLDENLQERPEYVPGRMYIGGIGLAKGYYGDKKKTDERFIIHPETKERLYWTGDLACYLPDGSLEFLGREDFQVKIQGYRIELEEIETFILKNSAVSSAVVTAHAGKNGTKNLVAYFVKKKECSVSAEELKKFISKNLPSYMVPLIWVEIDSIPLNVNGKVDRKSLPEPVYGQLSSSGSNSQSSLEDHLKTLPMVEDVLIVNKGNGENFKKVYVIKKEVSGNENGKNNNPISKLKFKMEKWNLRKSKSKNNIKLPSDNGQNIERLYLERRSHRKYSNTVISLNDFSEFLSSLKYMQSDKLPLAKKRYSSIDGLYPVQLYMHIKENRIEGIDEGVYYYHPEEHYLEPLGNRPEIGKKLSKGNQGALFDAAAFSLFLIADNSSIQPVYGKDLTSRFTMLEAGIISHHLELNAPKSSIGLCQIGELEFSGISEYFDLTTDHKYLHCLVGGAITAEALTMESLEKESDNIRKILPLIKMNKQQNNIELGDSSNPDYELNELILAKFIQEKTGAIIQPDQIQILSKLNSGPKNMLNTEIDSNVYLLKEKQELMKIWKEVLHIEQVGENDNFFDLGGNSLSSTLVISTIKKNMGISLTMDSIFRCPTISQLVVDIKEKQEKSLVPQPRHS